MEDLYSDDEILKILDHYKIAELKDLDKAVASQYIGNRAKKGANR